MPLTKSSYLVCMYCMKLIIPRGGTKEYRVCGTCRGRAIEPLSKVCKAMMEIQTNPINTLTIRNIGLLTKESPTLREIIHKKHFERGLSILDNIVHMACKVKIKNSSDFGPVIGYLMLKESPK